VFVKPFAYLRLRALLTNRLYHLQPSQCDKTFATSRPNKEFEVVVPYLLDWTYLRYLVIHHICRKREETKGFGRYRENIMLGTKNTEKELDIVNFIRR
jgi:hypothetical protein